VTAICAVSFEFLDRAHFRFRSIRAVDALTAADSPSAGQQPRGESKSSSESELFVALDPRARRSSGILDERDVFTPRAFATIGPSARPRSRRAVRERGERWQPVACFAGWFGPGSLRCPGSPARPLPGA
jgi:hypothetical protein